MLEEVYEKIRQAFPGRELVLGEGNRDADILLVGEAPGRQEVEQRRPFVGAAGKNLDRFLQSIRLERGQIYITNAVKFRPTRISQWGTRPTARRRRRRFWPTGLFCWRNWKR